MQPFTLAMGLFLCISPTPNGPRPSLDVLRMFPPQELIQNGLRFNRAFQEHQKSMRRTYFLNGNWSKVEECNKVIAEAKDLEDTWQLLDWAQDSDFIEDCRLDFLEDLRKALGEKDFWAGQMPPPAPLKYFRELD